ncbi:hypothetical protein AY606_09385 [Acinetobacter sp. SFB]|nr:hypothetical protein AY606_09385 [Acinetobacter sp. SFB]
MLRNVLRNQRYRATSQGFTEPFPPHSIYNNDAQKHKAQTVLALYTQYLKQQDRLNKNDEAL